ncbi:OmpH family outer membrane protein [Altererythrobacter lutimaris]|uniref:OmpH family outer membrane protein n=1 Tax=Altererythrobacter lutimaris TaxID=2743979 RepID=A0A850HAA3_9SPHN|nr:OmpH family outer membrane protein [Altererythrobacter lutimaris]NVE94410.1 OmpH family outer membrane protein [Altererythrobacter lutimaris]
MKLVTKTLAAVSLAAMAVTAAPAAAQVEGRMATVNAPLAVINTEALKNAYEQINTTYKAQIDQMQALNTESQTLLRQLDTNGDGQLDEAEQNAAQNSSQATRLQAIDQQMAPLNNQVEAARVYAVEQIMAQYGASLEQVVTQQNIKMILSPEAVIYAPPEANITAQVTTALNSKVSNVGIVPPQGWQPRRNSLAMYQQITQAINAIAAIQAQQQAAQQQQGNTAAPSGR